MTVPTVPVNLKHERLWYAQKRKQIRYRRWNGVVYTVSTTAGLGGMVQQSLGGRYVLTNKRRAAGGPVATSTASLTRIMQISI